MKIIKEEFKNFPTKNATTVVTPAEAQAVADEKEFDKRKNDVDKAIKVKLPVDGAPKAEKPKKAEVPEPLKESLEENINEEDAARIVQETVKNNFGVDVDVATYRDQDKSRCVIVEFIATKDQCRKMPYDELKEALYKRFGTDINISSKQFSSPNLKQKGTEYKLKLFVLKEKKDKSKIYAESFNESVNDQKLAELSKYLGRELTEEQAESIKDRWWCFYQNPEKYKDTAKLVIEDLVDLNILKEDYAGYEGTQPAIDVDFPPSFIEEAGLNDIEGDENKDSVRTKKRIALRDYINTNFEVAVPGSNMPKDKGEAISYNPKTKTWSSRLIGTEEGLQEFMDRTGIKADIKMTVGVKDWEEMGERDAAKQKAHEQARKEAQAAGVEFEDDYAGDDLDAFDRIWNDLCADTDHEPRRIPAIQADINSFTKNLEFWPNEKRYKSEDSTTATSNSGADVELMPYEDGMKIVPSGTTRTGGEAKGFDFAEYVAKVYEDYGAHFEIADEPDEKGRIYGIMTIDDEWLGVDTEEHEKKIRKAIKDGTIVI